MTEPSRFTGGSDELAAEAGEFTSVLAIFA
jgi:hypothetical protein